MLVVDVNILVAAAFVTHPSHRAAKEFLEDALQAGGVIGIPSICASGYLRLATDRRVIDPPRRAVEARTFIDALLASPAASIIDPGPRHWGIFTELIDRYDPKSADMTDLYIGAMVLERGATLVSFDRGFASYPEIRCLNPASGRPGDAQ